MERDEHIFAYVMDELESDIKNEALWIKAYAMVEGWEEKIKPKYMQYRVEEIKEQFLNNQLVYQEYSNEEIGKFVENNFDYSHKLIAIDRFWKWSDKRYEKDELLNLTKINMPGNELEFIPKEIEYLKNVTEMDFGVAGTGDPMKGVAPDHNYISSIPKEIGKLINLKVLNLCCNKLSILPDEIGKLINLSELNLAGNQLVILPNEVGNLKDLLSLNLGGNQLVELPIDIVNLKNLSELSILRNPELILTQKQKEWIHFLKSKSSHVYIDDGLLEKKVDK